MTNADCISITVDQNTLSSLTFTQQSFLLKQTLTSKRKHFTQRQRNENGGV